MSPLTYNHSVWILNISSRTRTTTHRVVFSWITSNCSLSKWTYQIEHHNIYVPGTVLRTSLSHILTSKQPNEETEVQSSGDGSRYYNKEILKLQRSPGGLFPEIVSTMTLLIFFRFNLPRFFWQYCLEYSMLFIKGELLFLWKFLLLYSRISCNLFAMMFFFRL